MKDLVNQARINRILKAFNFFNTMKSLILAQDER